MQKSKKNIEWFVRFHLHFSFIQHYIDIAFDCRLELRKKNVHMYFVYSFTVVNVSEIFHKNIVR